MRSARNVIGDVLDLWWPDGPEKYYVYGWVERPAALDAVQDHLFERGDKVFVGEVPVRYRWARWSCDGNAQKDGLDHFIVLYDAPGAGRFKVMEVG